MACPAGTRIKPEHAEDKLWITIGDAIDEIADWLAPPRVQMLLGFLQSVAPSLEDLNEICAAEPVPPDVLDWDEVIKRIVSGNSAKWMADWVFAAWRANRWSVFCECNPTTGLGPCPPIVEAGNPVTGSWEQGLKLSAQIPAPGGWTEAAITRKVIDATHSNGFYVGYQWMNAANLPIKPGEPIIVVNINNGGSVAGTSGSAYTQAQRDVVDHVNLWARPTGSGGQGTSTQFTCTPRFSATFTGTCTGTVTPPPPPPPPPPVDPVDTPWPPAGPVGCTTDTLCSMLYQLQRELHDLVLRFNAVQRYAVPFGYVAGNVHQGLAGSGSLPIGGLVGVRVDITSPLPPRQIAGTPMYLWDVGWMSIMTPEGMIEEKRCTRDTEVWQPRLIQEATIFGFAFKAGIVASVTELYPEPY